MIKLLLLTAVFFSVNTHAIVVSDAVYGPVLNNQIAHMATGECTTDVTGACEISVTIPGETSAFSSTFFNGYVAPVNINGRYIQYGQCMIQDGELGDRVTALQVEDRTSYIPEIARASFPAYPVLSRFFDPSMPAGSQGWVIWPTEVTQIGAVGYPKFVPAPLQIVAKFQKKTAVAGKKIHCNYNFSKYEQAK